MPVILKLGEVKFSNYEIPESINFGGKQSLSVKRLIGGKRRIDAMGRDDADIAWSGMFRGSTGLARALFLDSMRINGTALPLTWSQFNYQVVIEEFSASFERFYEIPYKIKIVVIQDLNKPFPVLLPVAYNDAIQNAITEASAIAFTIADPSVSSALALLSVAINVVGNVQNATNTELNALLVPLNNANNAVTNAISSLSASTFS